MHVVMNVTRITQTPYAFPNDVVYDWKSMKSDLGNGLEGDLHYCKQP